MNTTTTAKETTMDITNDTNQQIRVARYLMRTAKNVEQFKQAKIDLDNAKAGQIVFTISVLTNNKINYTRN
jgi:hypothetical protein